MAAAMLSKSPKCQPSAWPVGVTQGGNGSFSSHIVLALPLQNQRNKNPMTPPPPAILQVVT